MSGRLLAWLALVAAQSALAYGGRAAEGKPPEDILYRYSTAVAGVVQYGIVLGIVLAVATGPQMRHLLALQRPDSWSRAMGLSLLLLVAIYALSAALEPFLHPGREQGLTPPGWDPDRAGAYAVNFLVVAGVAPAVEELTFRGLGYSLLQRYGRITAVLAVGLTFGLVHGLVEGFVILAAFGAGLAWLRARTASVYPCMIVHGVFNAVALVVSVTA